MEDAAARLDDLDEIARLDPSHIFKLTVDFPAQCLRALELGGEADLTALEAAFKSSLLSEENTPHPGGHFHAIQGIVLAGMGGSAAAGDYIQAVFDAEGRCPFVVSRSYGIPCWADADSLVICSSYSGNTEETLASYEQAKHQGAGVLCITTGGQLAERARQNGDALIIIPSGQPPRTALGYMLLAPMRCLVRLGLLQIGIEKTLPEYLANLAEQWKPSVPAERNRTKQIALDIHGKVPVVYGLGGWQAAVAKRWKAQINENAKALAFANAFPELNHNEILGWYGSKRPAEWAMISLEDGGETAKMQARRQFTFDEFKAVPSFRVLAEGSTMLDQMLYLTLFGDFVSVYLAMLLSVDPGDIALLDRLKAQLSATRP